MGHRDDEVYARSVDDVVDLVLRISRCVENLIENGRCAP